MRKSDFKQFGIHHFYLVAVVLLGFLPALLGQYLHHDDKALVTFGSRDSCLTDQFSRMLTFDFGRPFVGWTTCGLGKGVGFWRENIGPITYYFSLLRFVSLMIAITMLALISRCLDARFDFAKNHRKESMLIISSCLFLPAINSGIGYFMNFPFLISGTLSIWGWCHLESTMQNQKTEQKNSLFTPVFLCYLSMVLSLFTYQPGFFAPLIFPLMFVILEPFNKRIWIEHTKCIALGGLVMLGAMATYYFLFFRPVVIPNQTDYIAIHGSFVRGLKWMWRTGLTIFGGLPFDRESTFGRGLGIAVIVVAAVLSSHRKVVWARMVEGISRTVLGFAILLMILSPIAFGKFAHQTHRTLAFGELSVWLCFLYSILILFEWFSKRGLRIPSAVWVVGLLSVAVISNIRLQEGFVRGNQTVLAYFKRELRRQAPQGRALPENICVVRSQMQRSATGGPSQWLPIVTQHDEFYYSDIVVPGYTLQAWATIAAIEIAGIQASRQIHVTDGSAAYCQSLTQKNVAVVDVNRIMPMY